MSSAWRGRRCSAAGRARVRGVRATSPAQARRGRRTSCRAGCVLVGDAPDLAWRDGSSERLAHAGAAPGRRQAGLCRARLSTSAADLPLHGRRRSRDRTGALPRRRWRLVTVTKTATWRPRSAFKGRALIRQGRLSGRPIASRRGDGGRDKRRASRRSSPDWSTAMRSRPASRATRSTAPANGRQRSARGATRSRSSCRSLARASFTAPEIMQLGGAWSEAIEEAHHGRRRDSVQSRPADAGSAFYQEGEIHRLRGELTDAEHAYRLASETRSRSPSGVGAAPRGPGSRRSCGRRIATGAVGDERSACSARAFFRRTSRSCWPRRRLARRARRPRS